MWELTQVSEVKLDSNRCDVRLTCSWRLCVSFICLWTKITLILWLFSSECTDSTSLRSKHPQILQVAVFCNPTFSKKSSETTFLTTFIFLWTFMCKDGPMPAVFASEHVLPCHFPTTLKYLFSCIYLVERSPERWAWVSGMTACVFGEH